MLRETPSVIPGTIESEVDSTPEWSAKRSYRCYFEDFDDETYVRRNLGPGLGIFDPHPLDPTLVVTNIRVQDVGELRSHETLGSVREWRADIVWSPWSSLLKSLTGDPVQQPPRFRFSATRITKLADTDADDEPVINSVGDPYNPPLEKDATSVMFIVTVNQENPDFANIFNNWVDHINTNDWGWFPARTMKLCPVNLPDRLYSQFNNRLYYPMEFQFEFNPDTWDKDVLNQGFREINTSDSTGASLRNVLIEGQPATDPVLLSADGAWLQPPVDKEDVVFNHHKIYKDFNFSEMGLDRVFDTNNAPPQGGD